MTDGSDPRLDSSTPVLDEAEPQVAAPRGGPGPVVVIAVLAVSAVALFVVLNGRREAQPQTAPITTPVADAMLSPPEPPLQLPPPPPPPPAVAPAAAPAVPSPVFLPPTAPAAPSTPAVDPAQRRRAPAVVVDLGSQAPVRLVQTSGPVAGSTGAAPATEGAPAAEPGASTNEAFAVQTAGSGPERAMATRMANPGLMVTQGTMIPAVLETAINSDLPGYTRAIVSRDVRSFDGRHVLIPRGSRLIGQYKSAMSLGASRAFVIWTRVVRPDGVSVQIGSPGTDALGRGGLAGEVDRHFFRRFGGSILLSVLNAGVAAVGDRPSTQIAIGSPAAAASAAASAMQGDLIPPTIRVAQGEAVQIFVARDLDFSAVGPMR